MNNIILEMKNIYKRFGDITVLKDVNFSVKRGEIHALCGENGAGKSTLMKVLSGVYPIGSYEGDIIYNDSVQAFHGIKESEAKGIVIIHQELALFPLLSITENIFIGNEKSHFGVLNWRKTLEETKKYMNIVGLDEDPSVPVGTLGVGKQQLIEIAKAISKKVDLLILDEPTAALNEDDSENLLVLLEAFKAKGITCIIISHKLNEITKIADSITVLRDGESICTLSREKNEISESEIIKNMVGRSLENLYPPYDPDIKDIYFEVKNWTIGHPNQSDRLMVKNVNFNIRSGEIVGIAGLMGSGRTELALSLFGKSYGKYISGSMYKDGKEIVVSNSGQAIQNGLAYVTEDRKTLGLVLMSTIKDNISICALENFSKKGVIDSYKEITHAREYKETFNIKSQNIFQTVDHLSGGNQQKVVLAKWLTTNPDVLILDEPTRGIDVGAKYEIYTHIQSIAKNGKAICIISSELPELLGVCDRIYTMNDGAFTGEFNKEDFSQEKLMQHMTL